MLHTFDHCARELTAERARVVDAGQAVAKDEIEVLIGVAGAIPPERQGLGPSPDLYRS